MKCFMFLIAMAFPVMLFAGSGDRYVSDEQNGLYTRWTNDWALPEAGTGAIIFRAYGTNDIHVAFSFQQQTAKPMYEFVVGGWGNSQSAIRRQSQGRLLATSNRTILDVGQAQWYWAAVDAGTHRVAIGYGKHPWHDVIVDFNDPNFISDVKYFSFSSWDKTVVYSDIEVVGSETATHDESPAPAPKTRTHEPPAPQQNRSLEKAPEESTGF